MNLRHASLLSGAPNPTKVVVVGAGGHGRDVLDVLDACNESLGAPSYEVLGVLDDRPSELNLNRLRDRGIRFLGATDEWLESASEDVRYLVGVGESAARRSIDTRMTAAGLEPATAIHPESVCGYSVEFAAGAVVLAGAVLATNISVGRHTHLHRMSTVGGMACVVRDVPPRTTVKGVPAK